MIEYGWITLNHGVFNLQPIWMSEKNIDYDSVNILRLLFPSMIYGFSRKELDSRGYDQRQKLGTLGYPIWCGELWSTSANDQINKGKSADADDHAWNIEANLMMMVTCSNLRSLGNFLKQLLMFGACFAGFFQGGCEVFLGGGFSSAMSRGTSLDTSLEVLVTTGPPISQLATESTSGHLLGWGFSILNLTQLQHY